jgi:hypothetical protein
MIPLEASAAPQLRSSATGRRLRSRGELRSPVQPRSDTASPSRPSSPIPRSPRRSAGYHRPRRSHSVRRDLAVPQPIWRLGPGATDTIPIAAPAIPRVRSIRLHEVALLTIAAFLVARPAFSLSAPQAAPSRRAPTVPQVAASERMPARVPHLELRRAQPVLAGRLPVRGRRPRQVRSAIVLSVGLNLLP